MSFVSMLKERNLLAQITHEEEIEEFLSEGKKSAYIGFDPTADSLHCGHLMQLMTLRRWQKSGHRAVALMGGGTAKIGDPSGKTDLRKLLDDDQLKYNVEKIKAQAARLLDLEDADKGVLVNNADWLDGLSYLPFLRDIGKHFSVNRMLTADCYKQRLEKGLTFLEFNYMILQSYDFLNLNREMDVAIQLGGDDQWSNILSGMELVRRMERKKAFCITTPLLTTADGRKMGKTENGAVWLDATKTSVFDFFQYWRNVEDQSVKTVFLSLTELEVGEIESLCHVEGAKINDAKVRLAFEITKLVHGEEEAQKAQNTAAELFKKGKGSGDEPLVHIEADFFGTEGQVNVLDLLVKAKIAATKSEGRRLVDQGGITIEELKITDMKHMVSIDLLKDGDGCLVKKGRKKFFRLQLL